MIFYEIELLAIPEFLFACSVSVEKYKNRIFDKQNFLEITYCEEGRILFEYKDGTKEITVPGMLIPAFEDAAMTTVAYQNEKQRHSTVGIKVPYRWKKYRSEEECDTAALRERMKQRCIFLIPYHESVSKKKEELLPLLKKIAALCDSDTPTDRINALSEWFHLCGVLTDFVLKKLDNTKPNFQPGEQIYVQNATRYIHEHYAEKLSVQEIARQVGISEGYLHRIFKKLCGMGITEYLNRHRVQMAIRLTESRNLSLKEAAYHVGIDDPAYMSRMFRKMTGMSYREYFRSSN